MKQGQGLEIFERGKVPVTFVGKVGVVGAEFLKRQQAGEQRQGFVVQGFAIDRYFSQRRAAVKKLKIGRGELFHLHLGLHRHTSGDGSPGDPDYSPCGVNR